MTAGGIIVLVVVGIVWVTFIWILFSENKPNQESSENQPEPKKPDSSL